MFILTIACKYFPWDIQEESKMKEKARILVVSDEAMIAEDLRLILVGLGYKAEWVVRRWWSWIRPM